MAGRFNTYLGNHICNFTPLICFLILLCASSANATKEIPTKSNNKHEDEPSQAIYPDSIEQSKRGPQSYAFGLGKKSSDYAVPENEQAEIEDEVMEALEDEVRSDEEKRDGNFERFGFGLGKKRADASRFNFGVGKREKNRFQFGLGKRGEDNSRFAFGLGKRESDESQLVPDYDKRGHEDRFSFGLGKRGPGDRFAFGLGKRGPEDRFAFGLGKRGPEDRFAFGLGKRGPEDRFA
ncbi:buccalin, partial [Trichonephila inaurata madagascariensis]